MLDHQTHSTPGRVTWLEWFKRQWRILDRNVWRSPPQPQSQLLTRHLDLFHKFKIIPTIIEKVNVLVVSVLYDMKTWNKRDEQHELTQEIQPPPGLMMLVQWWPPAPQQSQCDQGLKNGIVLKSWNRGSFRSNPLEFGLKLWFNESWAHADTGDWPLLKN